MIAARARREILGIVVYLHGSGMIKADRNEAPARPDSLAGAAPCPL
jgi:hypothetical protein